ncbi:NADP-dependent oxidoreductase domain-containing protein [Lactarius quietus]|nr:NADP-dependent oxidoreductase domain-containing protein [Lactarius quietus]
MVYNPIKVRCRLIGGAGDYGNNREAGEGVRRAGIVNRDELCAKAAAKVQLELWGLIYFDLFLVHFPETWVAVEELVDEELAKNIGQCSGCLTSQALQVELHPYLTRRSLLNLAKTLGIVVTAYSSLGHQSYVEFGWNRSHSENKESSRLITNVDCTSFDLAEAEM